MATQGQKLLKMSFGNHWLQYAVLLFSILLTVGGCFIFGFSIWIDNRQDEMDTTPVFPADLLSLTGVLVLSQGILGCWGTVTEKRGALLMFFIGLLLMFLGLIALGGTAILLRAVEEQAVTSLSEVNNPMKQRPPDFMYIFQQAFKCCGFVNGPMDWSEEALASCSCKPSPDCMTYKGRSVYRKPCGTYLLEPFELLIDGIIEVAFGLAALMLFGMVSTMSFYHHISSHVDGKNQRYQHNGEWTSGPDERFLSLMDIK